MTPTLSTMLGGYESVDTYYAFWHNKLLKPKRGKNMPLLTIEDLKYKTISLECPDGTLHLPVSVVVDDRAGYYGREGNRDDYTLEEAVDDTVELFNSSSFEIEDWLFNNMNVEEHVSKGKWVANDNKELDVKEVKYS